MSWRRSQSKRSGDAATGQPWGPEDVAVLERAVARAPLMYGTSPWSLTVQERTAMLHEPASPEPDRHGPEERDRGIACGAVLTNLVLAVRNIGWAAEVRSEHDPEHPDMVATVIGSHKQEPTATEGQRFRAITRRGSYRRLFHPQRLSHVTLEALSAASRSPAVYPRWVTGEAEAGGLAALLVHAAGAHRRDPRHQRELSMWMVDQRGAEVEPGTGFSADDFGAESAPAAGPATPAIRLPDEQRLTSWIAGESVLALSTAGDGHGDHINAGESMQLTWLTATSLGLVASVITRPLHLPEIRSGLRDRLGLPGEPHVLMRIGYPALVPGQRHA